MQKTKLIDQFDKDYSLRLDSETGKLYKRFVTEFFAHIEKDYEDITPRDIRNWLNDLAKEGYATSTRNVRLCGVKLFYQYLKEEGLIQQNPTERIPLSKVEETLPYYLMPEQLIELRHVVTDLQERAVVETLYSTGVRLGELIAMKKEDVNWTERSIHIPKGKRKKARIVLFTQDCGHHLKAYLDSRVDDLPSLFLNPYETRQASKATIQLRFKTYVEQLDFHLTPHTLRHTFAAHLAVKGMPLKCIQTLLGHENLKQTQYYARLYDHVRKSIYDEWM